DASLLAEIGELVRHAMATGIALVARSMLANENQFRISRVLRLSSGFDCLARSRDGFRPQGYSAEHFRLTPRIGQPAVVQVNWVRCEIRQVRWPKPAIDG